MGVWAGTSKIADSRLAVEVSYLLGIQLCLLTNVPKFSLCLWLGILTGDWVQKRNRSMFQEQESRSVSCSWSLDPELTLNSFYHKFLVKESEAETKSDSVSYLQMENITKKLIFNPSQMAFFYKESLSALLFPLYLEGYTLLIHRNIFIRHVIIYCRHDSLKVLSPNLGS